MHEVLLQMENLLMVLVLRDQSKEMSGKSIRQESVRNREKRRKRKKRQRRKNEFLIPIQMLRQEKSEDHDLQAAHQHHTETIHRAQVKIKNKRKKKVDT